MQSLTLVPLRPGESGRLPLEIGPDAQSVLASLPWSEGALVSSWLEESGAAHLAEHATLRADDIRPFLASASLAIVPPAHLAPGLMLDVRTPPIGRQTRAVVVYTQRMGFWSSIMDGEPRCLTGVAHSSSRADLSASGTFSGVQLGARPSGLGISSADEPVRGLRRLDVPDAEGVSHRVCLWVPDRPAGLRHPRMVYSLPGLGGREHVRFQDRAIVDELERWASTAGSDVVLVGVDGSTPAGCDYVRGTKDTAWSRFLARDLPMAVEADVGEACPASRRVLAGQSTGGFNALMLAMTHPGVFGTVVAASPDALDFGSWLLDAHGRIKEDWLTWMRFEDLLGGPGAMRSYGTAWSSRADGGVEWPAQLDTGQAMPLVVEGWLRETPGRLLETAPGQRALADLDGRLLIGLAQDDEFDLYEPAVRFCRRLDDLAIRYECLVDADGHFAAQKRLARLLRRALDLSLPVQG